MTDVKICGIKTQSALQACIEGGARFVGFVFYPPSPRYIDIEQAKILSQAAPRSIRRVGLFVDPSDQDLEKILGAVEIDIIQLHGEENPERITAIKEKFQKPVMKAVRVATKYDFEHIEDFEAVADWLLFDAKITDSDLPGGTGKTFDWSILKTRTFEKPWMLSGGLHEDNIETALALLKPKAVDISSGVEEARGEKDPEKIKSFIASVKQTN